MGIPLGHLRFERQAKEVDDYFIYKILQVWGNYGSFSHPRGNQYLIVNLGDKNNGAKAWVIPESVKVSALRWLYIQKIYLWLLAIVTPFITIILVVYAVNANIGFFKFALIYFGYLLFAVIGYVLLDRYFESHYCDKLGVHVDLPKALIQTLMCAAQLKVETVENLKAFGGLGAALVAMATGSEFFGKFIEKVVEAGAETYSDLIYYASAEDSIQHPEDGKPNRTR